MIIRVNRKFSLYELDFNYFLGIKSGESVKIMTQEDKINGIVKLGKPFSKPLTPIVIKEHMTDPKMIAMIFRKAN